MLRLLFVLICAMIGATNCDRPLDITSSAIDQAQRELIDEWLQSSAPAPAPLTYMLFADG